VIVTLAGTPLGSPLTATVKLPLAGDTVFESLAVPPGPEQVIVNVDVPLSTNSSPPFAVPTVFGVALHAFESPPLGVCVPLHAVALVELQLSVKVLPDANAVSVTVGAGLTGMTVTVPLSLDVPPGPVQVTTKVDVTLTRKSNPPLAVPTAFGVVLHAFESLPFGLCVPVHLVALSELQLTLIPCDPLMVAGDTVTVTVGLAATAV